LIEYSKRIKDDTTGTPIATLEELLLGSLPRNELRDGETIVS
jgi:hypothetical protein